MTITSTYCLFYVVFVLCQTMHLLQTQPSLSYPDQSGFLEVGAGILHGKTRQTF